MEQLVPFEQLNELVCSLLEEASAQKSGEAGSLCFKMESLERLRMWEASEAALCHVLVSRKKEDKRVEPVGSARWIIPLNAEISDSSGNLWAAPLAAKFKNKKTTLDSPSDLGEMEISPTWWHYAKKLWEQLAEQAPGKTITQNDVSRLESRLNALWTSNKYRAMLAMEKSETTEQPNALASIEKKRGIKTGSSRMQSDGKLRLPHESHKKKVCPFQTPESKHIGLHLFLTADAEYDFKNQGIKEGKAGIFSLGCGLVPYPGHTDGPRLSMGGKNLKQALDSISGAEPALVPGNLEGNACQEIEIPEGNCRKQRLFPHLGVNALVAVMPWEGLTYEDGLVVSRGLAEKLHVEGAKKVFKKTFPDVLFPEDFEQSCENIEKEIEVMNTGKLYFHGDRLFLPPTLQELAGGLNGARLLYPFFEPGELESLKIVCTRKRPKGKHKQRGVAADVTLAYHFSVRRPLRLGDKLSGRHGNKGVTTAILETPPKCILAGKEQDVDLIISPCSVIGRKNMGQVAEMVHAVLLWAKKEGILEDPGDEIDGERPLDWRKHLEKLRALGADDRGRFPVRLPSGETVRAFCGLQYICRLDHHSLEKLQARGRTGRNSPVIGQPSLDGQHTAQRIGEMENWSILSHGTEEGGPCTEELLATLRKEHSDIGSTVKHALQIFKMLGLERPREGTDAGPKGLKEPDFHNPFNALQPAKGPPLPLAFTFQKLTDYRDRDERKPQTGTFFITGVEEDPEKNLCRLAEKALEVLLDDKIVSGRGFWTGREDFENLRETYKRLKGPEKVLDLAEKLSEGSPSGGDKNKRIPLGGLALLVARTEDGGKHGIPVDFDVLEHHPTVRDSFYELNNKAKRFQKESVPEGALVFLKSLQRLQDSLFELLERKNGLFRRHLLGCRVRHSGRAVIIPRAELAPDEILLPVQMLLEMLEGYRGWEAEKTGPGFENLRNRSRDPDKVENASKVLDELLEASPLWVLAVRQPSLHRHNVQAFKARCWEEPCIGIPPFVTPGFNADFDGDTMAVFLPPKGFEKNLEALSPLSYPGRVGTGDLVLAHDGDLALGWANMAAKRCEYWREQADKKTGADLGEVISGLFGTSRSSNKEGKWLRSSLLELQKELAHASTASCSLSPGDFEDLFSRLRTTVTKLHETEGSDKRGGGEVVQEIKSWLDEKKDTDIARLLESGAKGNVDDLRLICGLAGYQETYAESATEDAGEGERPSPLVTACLWEGLDEDGLFKCSFDSRKKMTSKKLAVATAGYFSRRLAEGLYDTVVTRDDCGSGEGLAISWDGNEKTLCYVAAGSNKFLPPLNFPCGDGGEAAVQSALARIAWGRCPVGMDRPLDDEDLESLLQYWKVVSPGGTAVKPCRDLESHLGEKGGKLVLRSPLTCKDMKSGKGVCARCAGADPATRPFGEPGMQKTGSHVGLTAAQAIGERGTQLSMKQFHESGPAARDRIDDLKKCLDQGAGEDANPFPRFEKLLGILRDGEDGLKPFKGLPQAMIHFETALGIPEGLHKKAGNSSGRWTAAMAYEGVRNLFYQADKAGGDTGESLKSRIMLCHKARKGGDTT